MSCVGMKTVKQIGQFIASDWKHGGWRGKLLVSLLVLDFALMVAYCGFFAWRKL